MSKPGLKFLLAASMMYRKHRRIGWLGAIAAFGTLLVALTALYASWRAL